MTQKEKTKLARIEKFNKKVKLAVVKKVHKPTETISLTPGKKLPETVKKISS